MMMGRKINQFIGLLFLILALTPLSQVRANDSFGQASDLFHIGAGARSMGMGSAFTALSDDASAPYFNPAGLAILDEHQLMAMHAPLFLDSNFNYIASAHPFGDKWGSLAISDAILMSDKFEIRDELNNVTDSDGDLRNNAIFASYARKLPLEYLSAGVNLKFIQQKVAGFSDSDLGLDVGFLYKRSPYLSLGASFSNINTPELKLDSSADKYRPVTRFGVASEVYANRLTLTADLIKVQQASNLYAAGAEYTPNRLIAFRAGYNQNRSYTFGVGINFAPFKVDYAFSSTDVGAFNKVSFTWAWHNIYQTDLETPMKEGRNVFPLSGFENVVAFKAAVPAHVVANWSLDITDEKGELVRKLHGDLRPPESIKWDARNEVGEPVVHGKYNYIFKVNYKNGKAWKTSGNIDLALPNHQINEVIDMNLELNGARATEDDVK